MCVGSRLLQPSDVSVPSFPLSINYLYLDCLGIIRGSRQHLTSCPSVVTFGPFSEKESCLVDFQGLDDELPRRETNLITQPNEPRLSLRSHY